MTTCNQAYILLRDLDNALTSQIMAKRFGSHKRHHVEWQCKKRLAQCITAMTNRQLSEHDEDAIYEAWIAGSPCLPPRQFGD